MRESGDFPAMANTVGQISMLTSSEETSASQLAEAVLQDYGLAQKLLRLVNTAAFAQRGEVTTISRAVLLLGFERVRSVATGLLLFEHLQARARTSDLVDTLNMSFFSAILGRTIADKTGLADPEEAFISALFHNLGLAASESGDLAAARDLYQRALPILDRALGSENMRSSWLINNLGVLEEAEGIWTRPCACTSALSTSGWPWSGPTTPPSRTRSPT